MCIRDSYTPASDVLSCEAIWRLMTTRVERHSRTMEQEDVFVDLRYFLHFQRKFEYYAVNIIAPCCLLVIISLLVSQLRI